MLQAHDVLYQLVGPLDRASTLYRGGYRKGELRASVVESWISSKRANFISNRLEIYTVVGLVDEWRGKPQVGRKRCKLTI